jgi:ATP adenylyltransferase
MIEALWERADEQRELARSQGALECIHTSMHTVTDGAVRFVVRVVEWLRAKPRAQIQAADPFLPYEEALHVTDVGARHVVLLNKYNVFDSHLLLVTRQYEGQQTALTLLDFEALERCMAARPALAFYNAGALAGASQSHKHLQLVPLPLSAEGTALPIERALPASPTGTVCQSPELPFCHTYLRRDPGAGTTCLHAEYIELLAAAGLDADAARRGGDAGPYNLLVTNDLMLMVPRTAEHFRSISVNALGFAGSLLVRSTEELDLVENSGPLTILREVARPRPAP